MSAQTTLDEDAPMILDATCSYERTRKYSRHATIHIDNRPEVKPDIVMDNTDLKFPSAYFNGILYDPPHMIRRKQDMKWMQKFKEYRRKEGRMAPSFFERFGFWESKQDYLKNIEGVNKEFYRCLKPTGLLFCKISVEQGHKTRCITIEEFFELMTNFAEDRSKRRTAKSKSNLGKNIVYYLTMKPILTATEEAAKP